MDASELRDSRPGDVPKLPPPTSSRRRSLRIGLLAVVTLVIVGVFWINSLEKPRTGRSHTCEVNLEFIGAAALHYRAENGTYPRAYSVDEQGRRLLSWRVLLLPSLEHNMYYDRFDLGQPWDHPLNRKLADWVPRLYQCPSAADLVDGGTSYLAVVGDETMFPPDRPRRQSEITDGPEHTIMFLGIDNPTFIWTAPHDLVFDDLKFQGTLGDVLGDYGWAPHVGDRAVVFADGHTAFLPNNLPADEFRALLTVAGGERVSDY